MTNFIHIKKEVIYSCQQYIMHIQLIEQSLYKQCMQCENTSIEENSISSIWKD